MSDCIEWTGAKRRGYGAVRYKGAIWGAHRAAWDAQVGPIPDGMIVCHSCDNPACVNVEHLFLGTHLDNARDKGAKGRHFNQRKTTCAQGHPFDEENTYHWRGHRVCRACVRRWQAERRARLAVAR